MEALVDNSKLVVSTDDSDSADSRRVNGQGEPSIHAISDADTNTSLTIEGLVAGHSSAHPVIEIEKLAIKKGEIVAMVGLSGCGKTTLLLTIAGLLEPIKGEILFEGNKSNSQYRRSKAAITLQNFPLFHWLTVRQNLQLAAKMRKLKNIDFDEVLDQCNALHLAKKYPRELSGGERCRASLSQALLINPCLLLLDEPFSGLDTITRQEVSENIFRFARDHNTSVLFVTHDVHDVAANANRALVLGKRDNNLTTSVCKEIKNNGNTPDTFDSIIQALRDSR